MLVGLERGSEDCGKLWKIVEMLGVQMGSEAEMKLMENCFQKAEKKHRHRNYSQPESDFYLGSSRSDIATAFGNRCAIGAVL